jgi:hypothetical protein
MIRIRSAAERGHFDHGWLDTFHTFSFGDYHDPAHMQFRALRVMNEDRVAAGQGFPMHAHRDMEIVTCVLSGVLEHRDSLGNGSTIRPGELQCMTAGSGIRHSEFNPSATEPVHLYQIWLLPDRPGLTPGYEQRAFDPAELRNQWRLVAAPNGAECALQIHQDASVLLAELDAGHELVRSLDRGRHAWLQVLSGQVQLGEQSLAAGDGAALSDEDQVAITALAHSQLMLFDLA